MNSYLNTGLTLVGHGLRELMHVILILCMAVLAYYLVRNLPIDNIIAIALSVGAGLFTAYRVYGASNVSTLVSTGVMPKNPKINPANGLPIVGDLDIMGNPYWFDDEKENPALSHLDGNIYNND